MPIPLRSRHRSPLPPLVMLLVAAGCLFSGIEVVLAHGEPAELKDWGGLGGKIARCQRRIGAAGRSCAFLAWEARRACGESVIEGRECDERATDDTVRSAQTNARLAVNQPEVCTFLEVQNLRFIDLFEALTDVTRVCRDAESNLTDLVFESHGDAGPEPTRACRLAASGAATSLFRYALRLRNGALDRIITSPLALAGKEALLSWSEARILRARAALREVVQSRCSAADFHAVYGFTLDAFLTEVANQADCTVAGTYAQAAVRCPTAVCGNGSVEPGEQCDDGNDDPGDGCAGCFFPIADFGLRIAD
jgi:cysteine-rich repeat protein